VAVLDRIEMDVIAPTNLVLGRVASPHDRWLNGLHHQEIVPCGDDAHSRLSKEGEIRREATTHGARAGSDGLCAVSR
jgi:hypothetical protein